MVVVVFNFMTKYVGSADDGPSPRLQNYRDKFGFEDLHQARELQ